MIRMLLEDMLAELGCTVTASAATARRSLELAQNADFDVAILDVNLNGQPIYPVADILAARGTAVRLCDRLWRAGLARRPIATGRAEEAVPAGRLKRTLQGALDGDRR